MSWPLIAKGEGYMWPMRLQIRLRGFRRIWCENSLCERIGFGYGSE